MAVRFQLMPSRYQFRICLPLYSLVCKSKRQEKLRKIEKNWVRFQLFILLWPWYGWGIKQI